jgi:UDP-N-acetylbacillosamine N-acetyltransferase
MRQAIIIGAGGHSRVVLSLLAEGANHSILGVVDVNLPKLNEGVSPEFIMGAPVLPLKFLENLLPHENLDLFIAIGDCELRHKWWKVLGEKKFCLPNLISVTSTIDLTSSIGGANIICARAFIGPNAILGDNNLINTGAILEHEAVIDSHCHVAPGSVIAGRAKVGSHCFIGAGSIIIDRLSVANFTVLGAGAVVVSDIRVECGIHVGIPAKLLKRGFE